MPKTFLSSLVQNCSSATKSLVSRCCVLDNNSVPSRYVVSAMNSDKDGSAIGSLTDLIGGLSLDLEGTSIGDSLIPVDDRQGRESNYYFGQGIIEWVGKYILATESNTAKSLWFVKEFHIGHHVEDRHAMLRVDSFSSWLRHKLHSKCISLDTGMTKEDFYFGKTDTWEVKWVKIVEEKIFARIDNTFVLKAQWVADSCGLGVPGSIMDDILHHCNWAHAHCGFNGRKYIVQRAVELFTGMHTIHI